jgi:hypothetical protein
VRRVTEAAAVHASGLDGPYAEITFDFALHPETAAAPSTVVRREHAPAG